MEPGVFMVREETELLGWSAVERLKGLPSPVVIDMGCGSGNLTCGLLTALPEARLYSIDLEDAPLSLTRSNVARHGLAGRVEILKGDLFAPLAGRGLEGTVAAVVMNPPYIASSRLETDRAHLLENEPRVAFDGGPYGVRVQQRLIKESVPFLAPGGFLLFEFGAGQERQVHGLFARASGYELELARDEEGTARVAIARKRG